MVNSTPRYLPRVLTNILPLVLLISGCSMNIGGGGCYDGPVATTYTLDLHVVESDASWQHFSEVREIEFINYDQDPEITSNLNRGARYSADGSALVLNTGDVKFLHYGTVDGVSDSVWQEQQSVGYYGFRGDDIYPPWHELASREDIYDTLKNTRTGKTYGRRTIESRLNVQYKSGSSPHTLLSFKATFYDSTKYQLTDIIAPRFDTRGNIVFVDDNLHYKITGDSTGQRLYYNLNYQVDRLLRLHPDGILDTLFRFPSYLEDANSQINNMQYTPNTIAVTKNGGLYVLSHDGQELFHTDKPDHFMMSANGSAVTYDNGRYYYRFSDDKQLDLSSLVSDITFAQPYAKQVLVTEKDTALKIIDVNTDKIVQTVTPDQLPSLPQQKGKYSTTGIYYPLLTPDHHLRLIYSDDYYIDNPNDPCN